MKLAWALCQQAAGAKRVAPRMKDFLVQAVGLAALGTVADVVPLVDENRVLVRHGLESLAAAPTLGLATLMDVAKVSARKHSDGKMRLGAEDLGFQIAPRLNAAGRLGQPQLAVELLVTRPARAGKRACPVHRRPERHAADRSSGAFNLPPRSRPAEPVSTPIGDSALVLAERRMASGRIGIVAAVADSFTGRW